MPIMTKYEFCQLCADKYESEGNTMLRDVYEKLMLEMDLLEAEESI